jgi:integrase
MEEADTRHMIPIGTLAQAASAADRAAQQNRFQEYQKITAIRTKRSQKRDLASFAAYLASITGIISLPSKEDLYDQPDAWRDITFGLVEGYRAWLLQLGYAIGSVNRLLATVKQYAKLAYQAGVLTTETYQQIRLIAGYSVKHGKHVDEERIEQQQPTRKSTKKAQPPPMPDELVARMKLQPDTLTGWRDRFLVCLLTDHGLRIGEIAALTFEQFDIIERTFQFYREKVDLEQIHEMTPDTYHALISYQQRGGPHTGSPWLTIPKGGKPNGKFMSLRALQKRVTFLAMKTGLVLSPHDLRHYWATSAIRAGTDIKSLQDAGGWATPTMPLRYAESQKIANAGVKLIQPVIHQAKQNTREKR